MLTLDTLHRLWPNGNLRVPGLVEGIAASAPRVFAKYGITSKLVVAHIMAQVSHECGAGVEVVENLNYTAAGICRTWPSRFKSESDAEPFAHNAQKLANCVYNGRMGNAAGSDDGWTYRGRGGSQVTGKEGYEKLAQKTGINVMSHPELLSDPDDFLELSVADFILCGCLPFADQDNVVEVTRKLNGGEIGLAERKMWLVRWKATFAAEPSTPAPPMSPLNAPLPKPEAPVGIFNAIFALLAKLFTRREYGK